MDLPSLADFQKDLGDYFAVQLIAGGFTFPANEDPWKLAVLFYTTWLRTIARRSRIVQWSTELRSGALDVREVLALQTIEAESLSGLDLNPRMSRRQRNAEFHDMLLNDWGILHMHLGAPSADPRGFAGSTSRLLFVMVRPDVLYFIDVLDHNVFDYADSALLKVVHDNWPQLIEHARAPELSHVFPKSPDGHAKLRKAGAVLATELSDGTVYIIPGGGNTMSGANERAVMWANKIFNRAGYVHKWCTDNTEELTRALLKESGVELKTLRNLHLRIDTSGALFLVENTTNARVDVRFE